MESSLEVRVIQEATRQGTNTFRLFLTDPSALEFTWYKDTTKKPRKLGEGEQRGLWEKYNDKLRQRIKEFSKYSGGVYPNEISDTLEITSTTAKSWRETTIKALKLKKLGEKRIVRDNGSDKKAVVIDVISYMLGYCMPQVEGWKLVREISAETGISQTSIIKMCSNGEINALNRKKWYISPLGEEQLTQILKPPREKLYVTIIDGKDYFSFDYAHSYAGREATRIRGFVEGTTKFEQEAERLRKRIVYRVENCDNVHFVENKHGRFMDRKNLDLAVDLISAEEASDLTQSLPYAKLSMYEVKTAMGLHRLTISKQKPEENPKHAHLPIYLVGGTYFTLRSKVIEYVQGLHAREQKPGPDQAIPLVLQKKDELFYRPDFVARERVRLKGVKWGTEAYSSELDKQASIVNRVISGCKQIGLTDIDGLDYLCSAVYELALDLTPIRKVCKQTGLSQEVIVENMGLKVAKHNGTKPTEGARLSATLVGDIYWTKVSEVQELAVELGTLKKEVNILKEIRVGPVLQHNGKDYFSLEYATREKSCRAGADETAGNFSRIVKRQQSTTLKIVNHHKGIQHETIGDSIYLDRTNLELALDIISIYEAEKISGLKRPVLFKAMSITEAKKQVPERESSLPRIWIQDVYFTSRSAVLEYKNTLDYQKQIIELGKRVEALGTENTQQKTQIEALNSTKTSLEEQLETVNAEKDDYKTKYEASLTKISGLAEQNQTLTQDNAKLSSSIKTLQREYGKLAESSKQAQERIAELSSGKKAKKTGKVNWHTKYDKLNKLYETLKSDFETATETIELQKTTIEEQKTELEIANSAYAQLDKEFGKYKVAAGITIASLEETIKQQAETIIKLQAELKTPKQPTEPRPKSELEAELDEYKKQVADLTEANTKLKADLKDALPYKARVEKAEEAAADWKKKYETLDQDYKKQGEKLEELEGKISDFVSGYNFCQIEYLNILKRSANAIYEAMETIDGSKKSRDGKEVAAELLIDPRMEIILSYMESASAYTSGVISATHPLKPALEAVDPSFNLTEIISWTTKWLGQGEERLHRGEERYRKNIATYFSKLDSLLEDFKITSLKSS